LTISNREEQYSRRLHRVFLGIVVEPDNNGATRSTPGQSIGTEATGLAALLDQLNRDQEVVARVIAEAVRREVKEYTAFTGPEQFAYVVDDTQGHLQTFVRCAPSGRMPDAGELSFITSLAQLRAAAGFPLEAMLHAFRVGHRVLWDWLVDQVEDGRKGEVALAITPFMHEYLGVVTRRLTETYVEAVRTSVADADKDRRDLFEALLRREEPWRTQPLAQALGIESDVQYVVIVARVGSSEPSGRNELLRRAADVMRRRLLAAGAEALPILREDEVVLLVPWAADHRRVLRTAVEPTAVSLAQMYGGRLVAGGSMACDGLAEVSRGYQEARLAMERAAATGAFVALADASLYESLLALCGPSLQRRLPSWVGELAAEGAPEQSDLIRTLLSYLGANLSIERTARELFVHPNTVRYRLRRLSKLTGLDVASFYDLVDLVTAVRLLPPGQGNARDAGQE
jgi:sugar diacid utilization regulator